MKSPFSFFARVIDFTNAIIGIPILGELMRDKATTKGKEFLGIKDGGKGYNDEVLAGMAISSLSEGEQIEVEKLKRELNRINPKYTEAFILAIASYVQAQQRSKKETDKTDPKNPKETSYTDYDVLQAVQFVRRLLIKKTLQERIEFLNLERVFETFAPEKKPSPAKKAWDKGREKAKTGWKQFQENQQKDLEESRRRDQSSRRSRGWDENYLADAKKRYQDSKRKRR